MANRFDRLRLVIGGRGTRGGVAGDGGGVEDGPVPTEPGIDPHTADTESSQLPEPPAGGVPEGVPADPSGGVRKASGGGGDEPRQAAFGDADAPAPVVGPPQHVADPAAPGRRLRKSARKGRDEVRGMGAGGDE